MNEVFRDFRAKPEELPELAAQIKVWKPDLNGDHWFNAFICVYLKTAGSDDGLKIVDDWAKSGDCYPGFEAIQGYWAKFQRDLVFDPATYGFALACTDPLN